MSQKQLVILVHGWSVTNTDTYGSLPARLQTEAKLGNAPDVDVHHIYLSEYVSFRDVVLLQDLSQAFQNALDNELADFINNGQRFVCITHSTGGPVIRDWWQRFYVDKKQHCPMSHLIMLAPANFGSALAQLGKARLSRLKSWFEGVEPGEGILNWLELGSKGSWALNTQWICGDKNAQQTTNTFQFVLSGQSIDREFYDNLNTYTGELGSDGVVRLAAANLNASYFKLTQNQANDQLEITQQCHAAKTAFAIMPGRSHSGNQKGIMHSIQKTHDDNPVVKAILQCMQVADDQAYQSLCDDFAEQNQQVLAAEQVEVISHAVFPDRYFIHDQDSMLIFRMRDQQDNIIDDFAISLTGHQHSISALAPGFFLDKQKNSKNNGTLTYYLDYDVMQGFPAVTYQGKQIRAALPSMKSLGLNITAHPTDGLVYYKVADFVATPEYLEMFLKPSQTTLIDVEVSRVLEPQVFSLTTKQKPENFSNR